MTSAAALRLLTFYNPNIYNASTNPGGLDGKDGMGTNYLAVAADVGQVGKEVAEATGSVGLGVRYTFDSGTADADPGAGEIRLNNASPASATYLYASTTDAGGVGVSALLDAMDDSTSTTVKAYLILRHLTDPAKWVILALTAAVTTATGYRKLPVSYVAGPGGFAVSDAVALGFVRVGDKGDTGSGTNASTVTGYAPSTTETGSTVAVRDPNGSLYSTGFLSRGDFPNLVLYESDAGTDAKVWRLAATGGTLRLRLANDAYGGENDIWVVTRSGTAAATYDFKLTPSVNGTAVMTKAGGQFTGAVQAKTPVNVAYASTVTLDLSASNDFEIGTLTGNITFANPSTVPVGAFGSITTEQDGVGGRLPAWGTYWKPVGGAAAQTFNTAPGAINTIVYRARNATFIEFSILKGIG